MDLSIVLVSIITTLGGVYGMYMLQINWTRRQALKHSYLLKRYQLMLTKKLPPSSVPEPVSPLNALSGLAPILKNLSGDQIGNIVDAFTGGYDEPATPRSEGMTDVLLNYAEENPEIVKGLLSGITSGKKEKAPQLEQGFQGQ